MLLELDKDVALVLFELLASREKEIVNTMKLEPPERNALWSLEGALEKALVEPFSTDYQSHLATARKALIERGGE